MTSSEREPCTRSPAIVVDSSWAPGRETTMSRGVSLPRQKVGSVRRAITPRTGHTHSCLTGLGVPWSGLSRIMSMADSHEGRCDVGAHPLCLRYRCQSRSLGVGSVADTHGPRRRQCLKSLTSVRRRAAVSCRAAARHRSRSPNGTGSHLIRSSSPVDRMLAHLLE